MQNDFELCGRHVVGRAIHKNLPKRVDIMRKQKLNLGFEPELPTILDHILARRRMTRLAMTA